MKAAILLTLVVIIACSLTLVSKTPDDTGPSIIGSWTSYYENYDFYEDGTYVVVCKGKITRGTYRISDKENTITFSFKTSKADRRRTTAFAFEADGNTVMLSQSQMGTTVILSRA